MTTHHEDEVPQAEGTSSWWFVRHTPDFDVECGGGYSRFMWTDADFDEAIDEVFLGHHQMTPMGVGPAVPQEYFERFSGRIGRGILRGWERFGFDGFKGGRFWLTDPVEYAPVVEVWLDGLDLPFDDHWHCIAQTAMGRLTLWGEKTGVSLAIDAQTGEVSPRYLLAKQAQMNPDHRESMSRTFYWVSGREFSIEEEGDPLLDEVIEHCGPLGPGQVYGYRLPPAMGGGYGFENRKIFAAVPYLTLAADNTPRHLAGDPLAGMEEEIEAHRRKHLER